MKKIIVALLLSFFLIPSSFADTKLLDRQTRLAEADFEKMLTMDGDIITCMNTIYILGRAIGESTIGDDRKGTFNQVRQFMQMYCGLKKSDLKFDLTEMMEPIEEGITKKVINETLYLHYVMSMIHEAKSTLQSRITFDNLKTLNEMPEDQKRIEIGKRLEERKLNDVKSLCDIAGILAEAKVSKKFIPKLATRFNEINAKVKNSKCK